MARVGLNLGRVVRASIELADEEGLGAVSMARVAERLGFTTMSLYRHVRSKDELLVRMLDTALGPPPPFGLPDWRTGLDAWARELLAVLYAHPWGIDVPLNGTLPTASQAAWLDRGLEALAETGLTEGEKAETVLLVNGYVFWAARLSFQIPQAPVEPVVPPTLDLERLPSLRRAVEAGIFEDDTSREEDFAFGLERVLDGIAVLVARRLAGA